MTSSEREPGILALRENIVRKKSFSALSGVNKDVGSKICSQSFDYKRIFCFREIGICQFFFEQY